MWNKIIDLASGIGDTWLSVGGFLIGILIGGLILAASVKGARKRYEEDDPFAEWDEELEEAQTEKGTQKPEDNS